MKRVIWALALVAGTAAAQEEIKVSYQPALYWSLPYYIATEKGWWQELGLKPAFSTFPAGVPQIAASASKSWDVGGAGSVPAILGAARYQLQTIGITNEESVGNALMATRDKADAFVRNPASIKGQGIVLTDSGRSMLDRMEASYDVWAQRLVENIGHDELERLITGLERVRSIVENDRPLGES